MLQYKPFILLSSLFNNLWDKSRYFWLASDGLIESQLCRSFCFNCEPVGCCCRVFLSFAVTIYKVIDIVIETVCYSWSKFRWSETSRLFPSDHRRISEWSWRLIKFKSKRIIVLRCNLCLARSFSSFREEWFYFNQFDISLSESHRELKNCYNRKVIFKLKMIFLFLYPLDRRLIYLQKINYTLSCRSYGEMTKYNISSVFSQVA